MQKTTLAVIQNRTEGVAYKRLRGKGKVAKIALIAVVRKILILLNAVIFRGTPWANRNA